MRRSHKFRVRWPIITFVWFQKDHFRCFCIAWHVMFQSYQLLKYKIVCFMLKPHEQTLNVYTHSGAYTYTNTHTHQRTQTHTQPHNSKPKQNASFRAVQHRQNEMERCNLLLSVSLHSILDFGIDFPSRSMSMRGFVYVDGVPVCLRECVWVFVLEKQTVFNRSKKMINLFHVPLNYG